MPGEWYAILDENMPNQVHTGDFLAGVGNIGFS